MKFQYVAILGTGGTIAGTAGNGCDNIAYTAARLGIEQLLQKVPAIKRCGPLIAEQVMQVDSRDMSFAAWALLAVRVNHFLAREDVRGIVITHGTDTLEETAYFLHLDCRPAKPVVLTCAMRPATALLSDGPQNLLDSVAVARQEGASGVLVVCAGTVHSASEVQKVHPYKLDAFGSGDAGPIAYIEEGCLRILRNWPDTQQGQASPAIENVAEWPRVEIVMSYAGATGSIVDALVAQGVKGLVVAGTGNGTIHHALLAALLKAQTAGVKVLRATRCLNGTVLAMPGDLIPDSNGLSPVKARVALMLELMR